MTVKLLRDLAMEWWMWWDFGEALAVFEEGLRLYPDDPIFGWSSLFDALVCMGRTGRGPTRDPIIVKALIPKSRITGMSWGHRYPCRGAAGQRRGDISEGR